MLPKYSEIGIELLNEIHLRGGKAKPSDKNKNGDNIYESIAKTLNLSEEDYQLEIYESGSPRSKWENMVRWSRNDLRKTGHLISPMRGVWEITQSGYDLIQSSISKQHLVIDEITLREIKTRRGQPKLRKFLLDIFDRKCCITNCNVEGVLEAAHIIPHSEESNYSISNGLLLRADIHTLYDLNLISIDNNGKVFISESLRHSEYLQYQGKIIADNLPSEMSANLAKRFESFLQTENSNSCVAQSK